MDLPQERLAALDDRADLAAIRRHLSTIPLICAGGAVAGGDRTADAPGALPLARGPRSTIIQTSAVHTGYCTDPEQMLERLLTVMVRCR